MGEARSGADSEAVCRGGVAGRRARRGGSKYRVHRNLLSGFDGGRRRSAKQLQGQVTLWHLLKVVLGEGEKQW